MILAIDPHTFAKLRSLLSDKGLLVLAGDSLGIVLGTVTFYPDDGSIAVPLAAVLTGDP